jgi:hypothetical protein
MLVLGNQHRHQYVHVQKADHGVRLFAGSVGETIDVFD